MQQSERARDVRLAQTGEPAGLSFRQRLRVASHRLHEQQFGQLGQHGFGSRTARHDFRSTKLQRGANPFSGSALRDVQFHQGRQRRDHWIGFGTRVTQESADHPRPSTGAAVMNGVEPAVDRRLNHVAARYGRQIQIAAHQVQIVAREQRDLSGAQHVAGGVLALDADPQLTLDHVVIDDHVRRGFQRRPAVLGRDARQDAPRGAEVRVQEHAARQMRHSQDIR